MKKVTVIILSALLCVCMGSCNNSNDIPDTSVSDEYIENTESITENKSEKYMQELVKIFAGEWNKYSGNETNYETIIVNGNFTVKLQDVEYKWSTDVDKYMNWSENPAEINSFDVKVLASDNSVVETLRFNRNFDHNNERDGTFELEVVGTDDFFCNKNDFDIIEITVENFNDYFELKDILEADKIDNGLYTDYPAFRRGWALKGDMKTAIDKTEISYEYSCQSSCRKLSYDVNTADFNVLEATVVYDNVYNNVANEFGVTTGILFGRVGNPHVVKMANGFEISSYPENVKLQTVTGVLCVYK